MRCRPFQAAALASIEAGNEEACLGQLEAFINSIEAQRRKKIDDATANFLIAQAQANIDPINAGASP